MKFDSNFVELIYQEIVSDDNQNEESDSDTRLLFLFNSITVFSYFWAKLQNWKHQAVFQVSHGSDSSLDHSIVFKCITGTA